MIRRIDKMENFIISKIILNNIDKYKKVSFN